MNKESADVTIFSVYDRNIELFVGLVDNMGRAKKMINISEFDAAKVLEFVGVEHDHKRITYSEWKRMSGE